MTRSKFLIACLLAGCILLLDGGLAFSQDAAPEAAAAAGAAVEAAAPAAEAPASNLTGDVKIAIDTVWTMIAAFMVFFMNLGFALVESGFCRAKNCVNILFKNFVVFGCSSIAFLILGWGLMFGDGNAFLGTQGLWFVGGLDNSPLGGDAYSGVYSAISWATIPLWAKFFFQLVFAGTAATIVSGAVAERIKFPAFMIFTFFLVGLIYPIGGHWIWGGGWLSGLGMFDFAGSTVVHSIGGWAALAGVIVLGPRLGKYKDGKPQPIFGHNMTSAATGCLILWFGWFGFNPGSTMAADAASIGHIAVTTNTAAAAGTLAAMLTAWLILGKPDLGMALNGCLAGLVAITAPCAFVSIPSSLIIGTIGGSLVVLGVLFFDRIKIDDPVGATSVHLINGIFGTLAVGLFAQEGICPAAVAKNGLFFGGGMAQLLPQIYGILAVGAFVFFASLVIWYGIKLALGIRVSEEEEHEGLDLGEHGNVAYHDFPVATEPAG